MSLCVVGLGEIKFVNNVNYTNLCFLDPFTMKYPMMDSNQTCFMLQNCMCPTVTDPTLSLDRSIKEIEEGDMLNLIWPPKIYHTGDML